MDLRDFHPLATGSLPGVRERSKPDPRRRICDRRRKRSLRSPPSGPPGRLRGVSGAYPGLAPGNAARMMRNHKIHHLVVTSEQQVIGMISSYDLLKLVEGRRFEMKNPSTPKSRGKGKRAKAENF